MEYLRTYINAEHFMTNIQVTVLYHIRTEHDVCTVGSPITHLRFLHNVSLSFIVRLAVEVAVCRVRNQSSTCKKQCNKQDYCCKYTSFFSFLRTIKLCYVIQVLQNNPTTFKTFIWMQIKRIIEPDNSTLV